MAIVAMTSFPYAKEEVHQNWFEQGPARRVSRQSDQPDADAEVEEEEGYQAGRLAAKVGFRMLQSGGCYC